MKKTLNDATKKDKTLKKAIVPRRTYRGRSRSRSRSPRYRDYDSRGSGYRSDRSGRSDRGSDSHGTDVRDRKRKSSGDGDSSSSSAKKKKKPFSNDKKGTFIPDSLLDTVENGFFYKSTELLVSDSGLDFSPIPISRYVAVKVLSLLWSIVKIILSYFAVRKVHRENQFRPILTLRCFNDFVKKY